MESYSSLVSELHQNLRSYLYEDVFYLPSFGPVYSKGKDIDQLVSEVLGYWEDKTFLPYDKGKRWFDEKEEYIYIPEIQIVDDDIYLPILNTFGKTSLKVYVYSQQEIGEYHLQKVKNIASRILKIEEIASVSMVTTQKSKLNLNYHASNLYFKQITDFDKLGEYPEEIKTYAELSKAIQKKFEKLANEEDLFGSQMLWYRFLSEEKELSPIFVAVENGQILGMIGPMDTLADPWGNMQLLAPYFEVSNNARRKGFGRKLWESAMDWAYMNKAKYLLIQAEEGEAADSFYPNVGLKKRGTMYSYPLTDI